MVEECCSVYDSQEMREVGKGEREIVVIERKRGSRERGRGEGREEQKKRGKEKY